MPAEANNAVLLERRDVHAALAIFRVAPSGGSVPAFEPGQFTTLGLRAEGGVDGELLKRAFSIASTPRERAYVELYIRRVDEGRFTSLLWRLEPGAGLWLDPRVNGRFTLEEVPAGSDLLLVATGTGLAPFVSMIRTYGSSGRWRRCVLLEGARTAADMGYRRELEDLAAQSNLLYLPTLTRETGDWSGLRGRVQAWLDPAAFRSLTGAPLDPASWHALLCGNPTMIAEATGLLARSGFRPHHRRTPGQIHSERYW